MKKKEIIEYVIIAILVIVSTVMTYMYLKTKIRYENDISDLKKQILELNEQVSKLKEEQENIGFGNTFYATIKKVSKSIDGKPMLFVQGLDINDRDSRGEWNIVISDKTLIRWNGNVIDISELDIADTISITYTDETIDAIYPPTLSEIVCINLLDDEK